MEGVKLSFTEDALQSVATRAIARKTGARGCAPSWSRSCWPPCSTCRAWTASRRSSINREVAESRANPLFIYGKERAEGGA